MLYIKIIDQIEFELKKVECFAIIKNIFLVKFNSYYFKQMQICFQFY